jgi:hypothetical protein
MSVNPWQSGNRVLLRASDGKSIADWQFEFGDHEDLHMFIHHQSDEGTRWAEFIVVGGRLLLTKGAKLVWGREIEAVDGPILMLRLVFELLERAIPDGPDALEHETPVDIEGLDDLRVVTQSSAAEWHGPWRVKGSVGRNGVVRFLLTFTSDLAGGDPSQLEFRGRWDRGPARPQLDTSKPLRGWYVHQLRPGLLGPTQSVALGDRE